MCLDIHNISFDTELQYIPYLAIITRSQHYLKCLIINNNGDMVGAVARFLLSGHNHGCM